MTNRLDNLCFGAVWDNLHGKGGMGGLGGSQLRTAAGKAVPKYRAALAQVDVSRVPAPTWEDWSTAPNLLGTGYGLRQNVHPAISLLKEVFGPGIYGRLSIENPCNQDPMLFVDFVMALGPDATPEERRDIDTVAQVMGPVPGYSLMPPHLWHPNVVNLTYERDRQPFSRWRPALYNAKTASDVMAEYPWPGSRNEYIRAYREFEGHNFADLIAAGADTKGVGRPVPPNEMRTFITFSLLEQFPKIEDRAGALVRKRARKKARTQLTKTIMMSVISLIVGGAALSALGAGGAGLSKLAIGQLGAKQKRDLEDDLQDTANEFRDGAPAFAAEIDRVVAEIDAQIAPEGAYAVVVEGVKVADAPTLEEATAKAEAAAAFGDRFEILFNGQSTGLQVRAGGITIPIPKESEAQVRALTRDQAKAFAQKVTEAAMQTVKKEEAALVAAERQPAPAAAGGSVLVPILALAAAAFALKS